MEEGRLEGQVAEGRRPEEVAIRRVAREVLQAEVLVGPGAREDEVPRTDPEDGGDLRDARAVHPKVTEHLVRLACDGMARHAPGPAEEQESPALLPRGESRTVAPRIPVERRVGEGERELE